MCWAVRYLVPFVLMAAIGLWPAVTQAQGACQGEFARGVAACALGTPGPQGMTVGVAPSDAGEARAYSFEVAEPSTAYVYVGDLWYDLEAALWREAPASAGGDAGGNAGVTLGAGRQQVAAVRVAERRVVQFVRPAMIVERLEPGRYWVVVRPSDPERFTAARGFTLRVALGPPACVVQRDPTDLYLLALSYAPAAPTDTSLVSFNAVVSPPYSDLFDFEWQLDGQPLASGQQSVVQVAAGDLPAAGEHRMRVTARGVRQYPDPDPQYRHLPPTLSAECAFHVATPQPDE